MKVNLKFPFMKRYVSIKLSGIILFCNFRAHMMYVDNESNLLRYHHVENKGKSGYNLIYIFHKKVLRGKFFDCAGVV